MTHCPTRSLLLSCGACLVFGLQADLVAAPQTLSEIPFPVKILQTVTEAQIAQHHVSIVQFESSWPIERILTALHQFWRQRDDVLVTEPTSGPWRLLSVKSANVTVNYQVQPSAQGSTGLVSFWRSAIWHECGVGLNLSGFVSSRCILQIEGKAHVSTEYLTTSKPIDLAWPQIARDMQRRGFTPIVGSIKSEGELRYGIWSAGTREVNFTASSTPAGTALMAHSRLVGAYKPTILHKANP